MPNSSTVLTPTLGGGCAGRARPRQVGAAASAAAATQAFLAAAFLALPPAAQAQSEAPVPPEPPYGLSGRIGMSAVTTPTYEGSAKRRTLAAPDLTLSYRSREWGTVEFGQRGLAWNPFDADPFRFSLVAQFDLGRKDKNSSSIDPTPGDDRLAGMGRIKSSTEVGIGIGYGPLQLVARQALGDRGAKGAQVDMSAEIPWSVSDRLNLRFAVGATWANRDYMQTYFGVTQAQSSATSFSVYTPKAGCRKVEASLGADYALAPQWKLQANLAVSQLGDVAAASPLVGKSGKPGQAGDFGRRVGTSVAVGMAYEF